MDHKEFPVRRIILRRYQSADDYRPHHVASMRNKSRIFYTSLDAPRGTFSCRSDEIDELLETTS